MRFLKYASKFLLGTYATLVRTYLEPDDTILVKVWFVVTLGYIQNNDNLVVFKYNILCFYINWIFYIIYCCICNQLIYSTNISLAEPLDLTLIRNTNIDVSAFTI